MARRRRLRQQGESRQQYIYEGNVVRKLEAVPSPSPRREREATPDKSKAVSGQVRKNRRKAMHMSAGYVVFLAIAASLALIACVRFLSIRSEMNMRSRNISSLQRELTSMREANTTQYNALKDSVNLEDVRHIAIHELGMVHARPDQIIEYSSPTKDYVMQHTAVPESGVIGQ